MGRGQSSLFPDGRVDLMLYVIKTSSLPPLLCGKQATALPVKIELALSQGIPKGEVITVPLTSC